MNRDRVYALVDEERARQERKWGLHHAWGRGSCASHAVPDVVKAVVLGEECGEVSRAVLDRDDRNLVAELVQVAAVAVAWLESCQET